MAAFDGQSLPFEDNSFDVVCVCYVLHHLAPEHAERLFAEVIRVARSRVLLLEDSMPEWSRAYRVRNWAHLTESNILYEQESDDFVRFFGSAGFSTIPEWETRLSAADSVRSVHVDRLDDIKRYAHHTLFTVNVDAH